MNVSAILLAVAVLGAIGLVFGVLLIVANIIFNVPSDPKKDAIREVLPGANCGGCGYAGCDAVADAIAKGEAPVNTCPVGGALVAAKIAEIMGVESSGDDMKMVATVRCQGSKDRCKPKFKYHGIQDCVAAATVNNGSRACQYACLGLGTCVKACKFDAMSIDSYTGLAKVDVDKCTGCGACVKACPKNVLDLEPVTEPVRILCRAADKGEIVTLNCKIGCIGCEMCKNACQFDAITMVNHLPVIDREKCRGCMMCAEVCPNGSMWGDFDNRMIAEINRDLCVGCTLCKRTCKFGAISGELKQTHEVSEACTGCGECAKKCPKKAITLHVREHKRDSNATVGANEAPHSIPQNQ